MDTKRLVIGTLVGGLVFFVLGYLVYGMALQGFYASNAGTATGVTREPLEFGAIAVGSLFQGALVTVVLGWAGASSVGSGFRVGATLGFLVAAAMDFLMYGTTNMSNLTATLVDPLVALVFVGIGGAIIAPIVGRRPAAA